MGLGRAIKGPHADYYDVAPARRVAMGAAYFGLAGFLALAMWVTDQQLRGIGL
ncbi:MAG: hypothetical protein HKN12_10325, partial [Gemmatimonadetes bacterium]|nr:hypothetical protein [Gemmatimonadota bacterium]